MESNYKCLNLSAIFQSKQKMIVQLLSSVLVVYTKLYLVHYMFLAQLPFIPNLCIQYRSCGEVFNASRSMKY